MDTKGIFATADWTARQKKLAEALWWTGILKDAREARVATTPRATLAGKPGEPSRTREVDH